MASVKAKAAQERLAGDLGPLPGGERYRAANASLRMLVAEAYHVKAELVSGGPAWVDREFYELDAKAEGPSNGAQMRAMLRNLLADRFALRVRRETKEMPVYALTVDRDGAKLARAAASVDGDPAGVDPAIDQSMDPWPSHRMKWKAKAWPMEFLAERLGVFVERPVIDRTGLQGKYDFELSFVEDVPPEVAERLAATGRFNPHPTILEALRQQLGLRLEPRKGPVDMIVVEHAERPGAN